MKKVKTITVNGSSYQVCDPEAVAFGEEQKLTEDQKKQARENINAAQIDDTQIGENAWSGKKISEEMGARISVLKTDIDKCCLDFAEKGATVVCEPAEYPLQVVSHIEPIQKGSGVASPSNVRSFSPRSNVTLTRNDEKISAEFGQTIYGGNLDWNTGVLTIDRAIYTFDGKESYTALSCKGSTNKRYRMVWDEYGGRLLDKMKFSNDKVLCSKLPTIDSSDTYYMVDGFGVGESSSRIWFYCDQYATDAAGFKAMMKGAQLVYELKNPKTVQLTPHEIGVLTGLNTLRSDTGDTEVTGKMYPQQYHNRTLMQEEKENACQRISTLYVVENDDNTITVTLPSGKTKTVDLESLEKIMNAIISLGGNI